jgi:hypothetical protein
MPTSKARWERRFGHPAVLASIIGGGAAIGVAIAGAISGMVAAHYQNVAATVAAQYQHEAETAKIRNGMILTLLGTGDSKQFTDNVKMMVLSGILADPDGKICKVVLKGDCQVSRDK